MKLRLAIAGKTPAGIDKKLLERAVVAIGNDITDGPQGIAEAVINLKLVDDAEIEALNKKYSGQAKSTDVLSFSYIESGQPPAGDEIGDVAISLDAAKLQADKAKTSLETEVALLLIHGSLHVLGFDHATNEQQATMDEQQGCIMTVLGLTYRNFGWTS